MTRQAFLAQMPDPLSPRPPLGFSSFHPPRAFLSFSSHPALVPFLSFLPSPFRSSLPTSLPLFCRSVFSASLCLLPSDDPPPPPPPPPPSPSPLLHFLRRFFSPASEVSRDRVGWSLYSYRLLVPYSRETCARFYHVRDLHDRQTESKPLCPYTLNARRSRTVASQPATKREPSAWEAEVTRCVRVFRRTILSHSCCRLFPLFIEPARLWRTKNAQPPVSSHRLFNQQL